MKDRQKMKLYKRTWAEIDLDRLKHNYTVYRSKIAEGTEIMCVVKASCYGHSDCAAVPYMQDELGVKWFAVSNLDEAVRLRGMGITGEILILGYTAPEDAEELVKYNIIQAILTVDHAKELNENAVGGRVRCHAAIDTGMSRIGLRGTTQEIAAQLAEIDAMDRLCLEGAFTHYAVADTLTDEAQDFTKEQTDKFFAAVDEAERLGVRLDKVHTLNSAGGLYHYTERSKLARLGIILYGLKPDYDLDLPIDIKPVLSLKSVVSQVKTISAGETVSYGRTYTAGHDVKIATVACGYADGYPRALSNCGEILVNGVRCPIVGRVCMDQFMCDVTNAEVKSGDVVTLIGEDGGEAITSDDIAQLTGTIGYEIVCGISERVPRAAFLGGKLVGTYKL